MTESQSPLSSFDPFATHPFTNNQGLMPHPPPPSKYPRGVNPAYGYQPSAPATPPSGISQPSTPLAAPLPTIYPPRMTPPAVSAPPNRGIFYTYTPERRGTPELEDILAKKQRPQTWGTK
ncbi:hypothetical protein K488DRAFT_42205 [Vararia minispora EC-137]|uniref:Uncharacterized protein n=1 Tax=Vararia minispora EC-137 TaxID=1314806 RepID=A0ACB8QXA3_9AGAM|nr:hypothetical protein K488DRAFT_42205 [Vararia minispora EC-137]